MKIFLDTAHLPTIQRWVETGIVDGVTTNPTNLSLEGKDPKKQVLEICAVIPEGELSVEVTLTDPEAVYKQAKAIASLHEAIVVKIPCHINYYPVIKRLVSEGVRLNITLVFTVLQGFMMSKLGVDYISPFVGRLDDVDTDGLALIEQLRQMLDMYGYETQLLAASLRDLRHLHGALMAGADAATMPAKILELATMHPLTDKGIALFEADWKKLGITQFP
jgi:transaldolase